VPEEVGEVQKRVKSLPSHGTAIANHEFEKARFYSEKSAKKKKFARLARTLQIGRRLDGHRTREDIEEVVSRWTGIGVTSIKEDEQQNFCASSRNCTSA